MRSAALCTLDRCQGREATIVYVSLVRGRASKFFDMPKRWNVALTRARDGLFIVGDLGAYRDEAARARAEVRGGMAAPIQGAFRRLAQHRPQNRGLRPAELSLASLPKNLPHHRSPRPLDPLVQILKTPAQPLGQ